MQKKYHIIIINENQHSFYNLENASLIFPNSKVSWQLYKWPSLSLEQGCQAFLSVQNNGIKLSKNAEQSINFKMKLVLKLEMKSQNISLCNKNG